MKHIPNIDLFDMLRKRIEAGEITKEDIDRNLLNEPGMETKAVIETLHTLFCKEHAEDSDDCSFYKERFLTNMWNRPAHRHWWDESVKIINALGISPKEVVYITERFLYVISTMEKMPILFPLVESYLAGDSIDQVTPKIGRTRKEEDEKITVEGSRTEPNTAPFSEYTVYDIAPHSSTDKDKREGDKKAGDSTGESGPPA